MTLVTLAIAKEHLHVTDPARDAEVQTKLEHASDVIFKRIDTRADPTWTETTAPPVVQAVTLELLELLWRPEPDRADKVWAHIDQLLAMTRDPAMA
jgi:hypothetical protein